MNLKLPVNLPIFEFWDLFECFVEAFLVCGVFGAGDYPQMKRKVALVENGLSRWNEEMTKNYIKRTSQRGSMTGGTNQWWSSVRGCIKNLHKSALSNSESSCILEARAELFYNDRPENETWRHGIWAWITMGTKINPQNWWYLAIQLYIQVGAWTCCP